MEPIFERRINYYETDKMGVVHHSNYIRFLEEARCYFLDEKEMAYKAFEDNGVMIPVLGVNITYKTHVTFDDVLLIKIHVKAYSKVRLTISYDVINKETGDTVILAETKHCFTSTNLRPVNLKKAIPDFHDKFEALAKMEEENNKMTK